MACGNGAAPLANLASATMLCGLRWHRGEAGEAIYLRTTIAS
jgi:hypothetical protein